MYKLSWPLWRSRCHASVTDNVKYVTAATKSIYRSLLSSLFRGQPWLHNCTFPINAVQRESIFVHGQVRVERSSSTIIIIIIIIIQEKIYVAFSPKWTSRTNDDKMTRPKRGISERNRKQSLRRRRSIVVRTLVSAGELSLSCARLLAGRVTTLWLSRPLSVSQHDQLSHPPFRGR